jgi:dephospho-CoA kinase
MSQHPIPVIGLVGGIGSGKSALARLLAERLNGAILDADRAGHEALRRSDVKAALKEQFGGQIFDERGEINRPRLAERVFGAGEDQHRARAALERIVHPIIRKTLSSEAGAVRERGQHDLILLDAAIAQEAGWSEICDLVIYIDVPREVRLERIRQTRTWSPEDLLLREASQWPLEQKRSAADAVVGNSGAIESAADHIEQVLLERLPNAASLASEAGHKV